MPDDTSAVAEKVEKELLTVLALKKSTYAQIDVLIASYRSACEAFLFRNFPAAVAKNTEFRLWNAHSKINSKYRAHLTKFRDAEGKKRPVERRKLEKHYLDFIKCSARFYRGYIQRLASHFKSPKEVLQVALKLHLSTLSVDPAVETSDQETQLILESCHATLVRLGDLSRYRETEVQTKQRNWAPAVGYYDVAAAIKPSSGASHNQMAVIALVDADHTRALYHLYRALSVPNPYPRAQENLDTEFKKILDRKSKNQLFPKSPEQQPSDGLQAWFVYLHARLNAGINFPEHEELENEVLTNLSVELKERPLDGLLNKFALSNIAAQHLASTNATERNQYSQAFIFYFRFNVKTFFALLQILLPELEQIVAEDDELGKTPSPKDLSDRISATARRILPCLRQYSSWLVSNAAHLARLDNHETVGVQITEFWRIYANALTLLAATFQKSDLPNVEYLLEEDEDTIAFTPFTNSSTSSRFFQADGVTMKPRSRDQTVQRHHPCVEMLFRVRGLLEDGFALVTRLNEPSHTPVPLIMVGDARFEFKEKGLPSEPSFNKSHSHSHSATSINRDDIERAKQSGRLSHHRTGIPEDASESLAPSLSTNTTMRRMVDGLVASEVSENHEPSPHFPQISHGESPPKQIADKSEDGCDQEPQSGTNGNNVRPLEGVENIRPMLPTIWNSPFTPLPGETDSSHTRPSTAYKHPTNSSTSKPPAQSSNVKFQEALLCQQEELEMQQNSIYDVSTTTSIQPASSGRNTKFLGLEVSPIPSPFPSSPSIASATFPSYDVPRNVAQQSRFGAVGEIPPSGQGG